MKNSDQNNLLTGQILRIKKIIYVASICLVMTILASCTAEEVPTTKQDKNQALLAKEGDIDPPIIGNGTKP
jgi:hypothetical protein